MKNLLLPVGTASLLLASLPALAAEQRLLITPHQTDERLAADELPHLVVYDLATEKPQAPLLVWLPGTNGRASPGQRPFFETVQQQGYRLISLTYLNSQSVSQVCVAPVLRAEPSCAGRVRQQRVWGEPQTRFIADKPEEAIVPRLTRLLQHLARSDAAGQWAQYLDGEEPRWERIVLAGQSQGGGMAGFIAQTRRVAGVLMFSGGWDHGAGGDIAGWYSRASQTPAERWHGTFHVDEPQAATMERIYRRQGVPVAQIHALSQPVRPGGQAHGEGIANPVYKPMWEQMLKLQP